MEFSFSFSFSFSLAPTTLNVWSTLLGDPVSLCSDGWDTSGVPGVPGVPEYQRRLTLLSSVIAINSQVLLSRL
jgi:hypothetical protein